MKQADPEKKPIFLSIDEAAEYLNVSPATVRRWTMQTENPLPSYKPSPQIVRIRLDELDMWMENYQRENKEEQK